MNSTIKIIASIMILLGICFVFYNIFVVLRYFFSKLQGSLIPLLGGTTCALGIHFITNHIPYIQLIPFIIDPGCSLLIIGGIIKIVQELWRKNRYK